MPGGALGGDLNIRLLLDIVDDKLAIADLGVGAKSESGCKLRPGSGPRIGPLKCIGKGSVGSAQGPLVG